MIKMNYNLLIQLPRRMSEKLFLKISRIALCYVQ